MGKDPAVLFYTSDFLTGTSRLTDEQCGQYIRALCSQHQEGHFSKEELLQILKSYDSPVWKKFIQGSDGLFFNERMRIEIERRLSYCESKSHKGKAGRKKKSYDNHTEIIRKSCGNHNENENENRIKDEKIKYLDHVYLTEVEHGRLLKELGKKFLDACIFKLNAYLTNNPHKQIGKKKGYRDLNLVMRDWVINAVKESGLSPVPEQHVTDREQEPIPLEERISPEEAAAVKNMVKDICGKLAV